MDHRRTEQVGLPAGTWIRTTVALRLARVVDWRDDGWVTVDVLTWEGDILRVSLHFGSIRQTTPSEEELGRWAIAELSR